MSEQDSFAIGTIFRLYVDHETCYIELDTPLLKGLAPQDNLFILRPGTGNYDAIYALLLVAMANGYRIEVRTFKAINAAQPSSPSKDQTDRGNGVVAYIVAWRT